MRAFRDPCIELSLTKFNSKLQCQVHHQKQLSMFDGVEKSCLGLSSYFLSIIGNRYRHQYRHSTIEQKSPALKLDQKVVQITCHCHESKDAVEMKDD